MFGGMNFITEGSFILCISSDVCIGVTDRPLRHFSRSSPSERPSCPRFFPIFAVEVKGQ